MFPILLRHVNIPLEHITIIDFKDKSADLKAWTTRGLQFYKKKVSPKISRRSSPSISRPAAS